MSLSQLLLRIIPFVVLILAQPICAEQIFSLAVKSSSTESRLGAVQALDRHGNGIYATSQITLFNWRFINQMFLTNAPGQVRRGGGKEVKHLYGYTNLGYLSGAFSTGRIDHTLLFGRDTVTIGYGKNANLLLSDWSRPFDQFRWKLDYRNLAGLFVLIQLENMDVNRRWLVVHSLTWSDKDRFSFTVAEAAMLADENRVFELQYLNPFLFWIPEQENPSTGSGNFLLLAAGHYRITPHWSVWGEFLLDDIQINRESKGDLEPDELGLIFGTGFTSDIYSGWLEYNAVTNRTYQTPKYYESITHRGYPVGHYLGNDFDQLRLHGERETGWKKFTFSPYVDISYIRDGSQGLDTPFDTPWMDFTVTLETGYSEPFPTKPVTYVTEFEAGIAYQINKRSSLTAGYFWQRREKNGVVQTNSELSFRLWLEIGKRFDY